MWIAYCKYQSISFIIFFQTNHKYIMDANIKSQHLLPIKQISQTLGEEKNLRRERKREKKKQSKENNQKQHHLSCKVKSD